METRIIAVDIQPGYNQASLKLHQGDIGIPVGFAVFDGGKEVELSQWESSNLSVTKPSGDSFDVPCEIEETGIVCKVPEEMTEKAWNLFSRLVLSSKEITVRTEDILISVSGADAYQQEKAETKAYEKALADVAKKYEDAKTEYEKATLLQKDNLASAKAVKKISADADKKIEAAITTYEDAKAARSEYLKVLKKLESELIEAKEELKKQSDKMLESSLILKKASEEKEESSTLLKKATEEKKAAKANYERACLLIDGYMSGQKKTKEVATEFENQSGYATTDITGKCFLYIKEIPNADYEVKLKADGKGDVSVVMKYSRFFLVEGTPQLGFTWEVKANDYS